MIMKTHVLLLTFLSSLILTNLPAQSWQWGISGGSYEVVQSDERIESMTTDKDGNVSVLARIGKTGLQVDGVTKEAYGSVDYMIASFSCTGDYKWSRVIGSAGSDRLTTIQSDADGNIYVAGSIGRNSEAYFGGESDIDMTLPYSSQNDEHKQNLFLAKYNSDGDILWMRMPQADDITQAEGVSGSLAIDLQTAPNGHSYWWCYLPQGLYADGAFEQLSAEEHNYVLEYDSEGNFVEATMIDLDVQGVTPNWKLLRNHNTGNYYVAGDVNYETGLFTVGDEFVTNNMFLLAFNEEGNYLWKKENSHEFDGAIEDFYIDNDNMLYLTGGTSDTDTFAGITFSADTPGTFPFIIKLNEDGELVWSTNGSTVNSATRSYGITVTNEEVAITCGHGNLYWEDSSLEVEVNAGYDVMLGRFDKWDGSLIGLEKLESNMFTNDYGKAITHDDFGSYYIGGQFYNLLYVAGETLTNGAQDWDFFVAKYGTDTCDCDPPVPSFAVVADDENAGMFEFSYDGSTLYDSILWEFGDTSSSSETNPTHSFEAPGSYNVCVTVSNECSTEQYCEELTVSSMSVELNELEGVELVAQTEAGIELITSKALDYSLYSLLGQELQSGHIPSGTLHIAMPASLGGVYFLQLRDARGKTRTMKLYR
jgi:PKD repeat protein